VAPVSGVFESEANLDSHLEVIDLAVANVTANLSDLEPIQVTQRLCRTLDAVSDGRIDALSGCADDFSDAVCAIRHVDSSTSGFCEQNPYDRRISTRNPVAAVAWRQLNSQSPHSRVHLTVALGIT
jgi:hypothetical protein